MLLVLFVMNWTHSKGFAIGLIYYTSSTSVAVCRGLLLTSVLCGMLLFAVLFAAGVVCDGVFVMVKQP